MENTSSLSSLTALSSHFTPPSITEHLSSIEELRREAESGTQVSAFGSMNLISSVVPSWDYVQIREVLDYVRSGIEQGVLQKQDMEYQVICSMANPGSTSKEKAQWIQDQGFDIQLSLDSPEKHIQQWGSSKCEDAFDWAIEKLVALAPSEKRSDVFRKILTTVLLPHSSYLKSPQETTRWTTRRIDIVEHACPGLVREWVSSLPTYSSTPQQKSSESAEWREGMAIRDKLRGFLFHTMVSGFHDNLADWLDPSRYGTPKSLSTLFEGAVFSIFSTMPADEERRLTWISISRALEIRPAAKAYWQKQTRSSNLQPICHDHRPGLESFPSQSLVFGGNVIGREYAYGGNDNKSPRWDDRLPLNPLGRLLAKTNPVVSTMVATSEGRQNIIDTMISHPVFMAYGFALFGSDILGWDESAKFKGFRDEHGYGVARYALAVCSPVTSSFDVVLHRMLRQYKDLCDEASPSLASMFISSDARSKFMAMELRKISSKVSKQSEIKRESRSSFKM